MKKDYSQTVGKTTKRVNENASEKKQVINLGDGNFFNGIIEMIEEIKKGMEYPVLDLTLTREMIHRISHEDFGMSKVMLLNELERRLNELYNPIGLYTIWRYKSSSEYLLTVFPKEIMTPSGKEYFSSVYGINV